MPVSHEDASKLMGLYSVSPKQYPLVVHAAALTNARNAYETKETSARELVLLDGEYPVIKTFDYKSPQIDPNEKRAALKEFTKILIQEHK